MNPDWNTLAEVNFLLYRRMSEHLNAALAALEPAADSVDGIQPDRAAESVHAALGMYSAWSNMIRHKAGETPLIANDACFDGQELLRWVGTTLHIAELPTLSGDQAVFKGNRETLQEALISLQSCAHALGPGVRIIVESHLRGVWFRVRYGIVNQPPATLDELLESLQANWRVKMAGFELSSARDFLSLNNTELFYTVRDQQGELAFFVWFAQQSRGELSRQEQAKVLLDSFNADDTYQVITEPSTKKFG